MKIKTFEEIQAWQKAEELSIQIYQIFSKIRDFKFRDQIQSASVSIMNNIAEGFERQGNKEFARFLFIAKGSCGEVRSMSHLALKLNYIDQKQYQNLISKSTEISKMIYGLIQSL